MQLLMVILPIMLNDFNTIQALFTESPASQLDHESGRVPQEWKGKSVAEGCTESLLLTENCSLQSLTNPSWRQTLSVRIDSLARIFSTKLIISAIKGMQNFFYIRDMIVSRNDFFLWVTLYSIIQE